MTKLRFLVATDFSEVANNALVYALELATFLRAEVSILHVYHLPLAVLQEERLYRAESYETYEQMLQEDMQGLRAIVDRYPGVRVQSLLRRGLAVDIIKEVLMEASFDLLVVGTRQAGGIVQWLGSVTSLLIREVKDVPVLAVPPDARFHGIYHIAFATDYKDIDINKAGMRLIKYIAERFDAAIHIVHVKPVKQGEANLRSTKALLELDSYFSKYRHDYYLEESDDPSDAIERYVENHNIDWLVMMPHEKGLFKRLLSQSQTRRMLFKTRVPLLSIHA